MELFDRLLLFQTISKINLAIFRMRFVRIDHCDCCRLGNPANPARSGIYQMLFKLLHIIIISSKDLARENQA